MTFYQTYITDELTKEKADVKALKKEISQMKKDVSATKKEIDRSKDEELKEELAQIVQSFESMLEVKKRNLFKMQQHIIQLETMKKLRYAKLKNGVIVETSKLDQFKKRFAKYRMEYESIETGDGLIVSYQKDGVKGKLTLFACLYEFPEFVTFPQID